MKMNAMCGHRAPWGPLAHSSRRLLSRSRGAGLRAGNRSSHSLPLVGHRSTGVHAQLCTPSQASACVVPTNFPLAKAGHLAKPHISAAGSVNICRKTHQTTSGGISKRIKIVQT